MSQGYDGASVMSGHCSGVQTRIREVAPQAIYTHCNAHCLNLALVDSVKAVREASEFFLPCLRLCMCSYLQQNVIQFSSNSRKNCILKNSNGNYRDYQTPRWVCRHGAVSALCYSYDAVLATLTIIVDGSDGTKAAGLGVCFYK